jgi:hypothetical protein
MGTPIKGRRMKIGRSRVNILDFLYFARGTPGCVQSRQINVAPLAAAREASPVRISWSTLFIRAMVIVSTRWPFLRQCYMRWPWPHIYEAEQAVAMITVQRELRGENWVFFGRLKPPETDSLQGIEKEITEFRTGPADRTFKVQYGQSGLPTIIRRAMIGIAYYLDPGRRVKHFGTFGLTTVGSRGSTVELPPLLASAAFTYGPIDENGNCKLTLVYDHRLIDGAPIAEILADVEKTLDHEVREEFATFAPFSGASKGQVAAHTDS